MQSEGYVKFEGINPDCFDARVRGLMVRATEGVGVGDAPIGAIMLRAHYSSPLRKLAVAGTVYRESVLRLLRRAVRVTRLNRKARDC